MADFLLKQGKAVQLAHVNPNAPKKADKDKLVKETDALQEKLYDLQGRLYAESKQALLIVLQAMDTGGKDGAIRKVFSGVNPQGVQVTPFKAPTPIELAHDYLWRVHQAVPPKGYIGIFNRSHYEDVLVVRVNNLVPKEVWEKRYNQINEFEELLAESGTRILKFYLHIDKAEQKERLEARLADPTKQWKFSTGDLPVREQWDAYMEAYEAALERCNAPHAPWVIVPANNKWYRDWVIAKTIVKTLEDMNPQYPPPEEGLDKIVIPD